MKVKFICETCGKEYHDRDNAIACEALHKKEQEQAEQLAAEKDARQKQILELWNSYLEDSNEYPIETIAKDFPFIRFFGF